MASEVPTAELTPEQINKRFWVSGIRTLLASVIGAAAGLSLALGDYMTVAILVVVICLLTLEGVTNGD